MASYSAIPSEALVKACVGSDSEAAWAEFVRRFQPLVARVALRTARRHTAMPQRHLIDDLVSETYLKLCADKCRLLRDFEPRHPDAILGFLKSVTGSVVLDHFKSERARKRDTNQTDTLSEETSPERSARGSGGLAAIDRQIVLRQLDELVTKLFQGEKLERNRTIFWLHNHDGMTAKAIASIPWIGLNTKGVESVLQRMTQVIQSHIEGAR